MILHVFLQPRLAASAPAPPGVPRPHGGGGKRSWQDNRGKGKGKGFMGRAFGKGKQSASGRSDSVKISGQVLTICRDFNSPWLRVLATFARNSLSIRFADLECCSP